VRSGKEGIEMKSKRFLTFVTSILVAVSFFGCAGFHRQAFNKDANQDIKRIGIIEQIEREKYCAENMGHVGTSFGLIGGTIAIADMASKRNTFTGLMKARDFKAVNEFQGMLLKQLEDTGYSVKMIKAQRAKHALLEKYDGLDNDVDVYLDFTLDAGYICASSASDYIPHISLITRLVKRGTNEILYQELIYYGYKFETKESACLPSDQQYYFRNFDTLKSNPDLALEGLRKGVGLVSDHIAQSLRR